MSPRYLPLALLALVSLCCAPAEPTQTWTAQDVEITRLRLDPGEVGLDARIRGEITNHTAHMIDLVEVHTVFKDRFGTVVGRPTGTRANMQPGERSRFEVSVPSELASSGESFVWRITHLDVHEGDRRHEIEVPGAERFGVIESRRW